MERCARYAIYWAPEAGGPLAQFGAQWLGWDADAAVARRHLAVAGLPAPLSEITSTPRRYGFHATLKPPFALGQGASPSDLLQAVEDLAARTPAFDAPPLMLARDHGFASLRLSGPAPAMDALAADAVAALDRFRAPSSAADLARRRAAPLGPQAEANLSRWGYPWVMDLFRFHLTLSGPLAPDALARTCDALAPLVAPFCAASLPVREVCMFGDPGDGRPFRLLARAPLDRGRPGP